MNVWQRRLSEKVSSCSWLIFLLFDQKMKMQFASERVAFEGFTREPWITQLVFVWTLRDEKMKSRGLTSVRFCSIILKLSVDLAWKVHHRIQHTLDSVGCWFDPIVMIGWIVIEFLCLKMLVKMLGILSRCSYSLEDS